MRTRSVTSFAVLAVLISACGRSGGDVETAQAGPQRPVLAPFSQPQQVQQPNLGRSLGQPRLSRLTAQSPTGNWSGQVQAPPPPTATFSQYDGRLPGDANVPSGVPVRSAALQPRRLPEQGSAPSRDVVDVGLNRPVTPRRAERAAPTRIASISRAPAPTPRPVASTPTPIQRPLPVAAAPAPQPVAPALPAPVAPVLPPQPSIAALQVPGLSAPTATLDTNPTGLPVLRSVEQAVPLGTIPASLGVANIEAAEAALPKADQLEQSVADDSGALSWTQAASLIRAGEVETATDIGEFEVLLTLCSGRGVLTVQPTPTALADLAKPKVVCGKAVTLTSQ